jgi:hypothetical protein
MTSVRGPDLYHPWTTYILACDEAKRRGDRRVGTEHLLLGLLGDPAIEAILGVSHDEVWHTLADMDNEALAAIGLPESMHVPPSAAHARAPAPSVFKVWKVHMKMTPLAAAALKEFGPPMRHHQPVTSEHLLVSLVSHRPPDPASVVLERLKVDVAAVRLRLEGELANEA